MNGKQVHLDPGVFSRGILAALPEVEWRAIIEDLPPRVYERKSLLYEEGDTAAHAFIPLTGLVKTFKSPPGHRDQIINICGAGDVLGAEALFDWQYCESASALARTPTLCIPADRFSRLLEQHPSLAQALIRSLCEENERVHTLVVDLGTKKALPRVASCILLFMDRQKKRARPEPFNIPISRQEMGAYLGLSPETVSRQLKGLVTSRVIRLDHRRLTVLNEEQLRSIAQAH